MRVNWVELVKFVVELLSVMGALLMGLKKYINGGIVRIEATQRVQGQKLDEMSEHLSEVRERTAGIEGHLGFRWRGEERRH